LAVSSIVRGRRHALASIHRLKRAHLLGIAGSGMRSLADVLSQLGWQVSGSDERPRSDTTYRILPDDSMAAIDRALDLVVYSPAIPPEHPQLARARQLAIPTVSYPQMIGRLMETRAGVAVAGTHGKSTTTAMLGAILATASLDPTLIYGAEPIETSAASRLGQGRWLVAEACEYRESFCHLRPRLAAILNVELDHVDCFTSLAEVEAAFRRFAEQLPADGLLLARHECAATRRVVEGLACSVETFGFATDATWTATALRERRGCYTFELRRRGSLVCDIKLATPGRHHVLNAMAAAALANHCGASGTAIRAGLERFAGLRRRLEVVADDGSNCVIDDYAHHPTAVAAALATVRQMCPGRRIWCVFEPHQASRTRRMRDEFARSLQIADKIVVTEVFCAREPRRDAGDSTAADLAERVAQLGWDARYLSTTAEITQYVQHALAPGDVVVTLGAGGIASIAHEFGHGIRKIRKAG
jgi:UDP-N-acetylmuramate--alanine ligase